MRAVFIDIDNTILSFDEYVKYGMRIGFDTFGLKEYEPWMYDVFKEENDKLWMSIEKGELTFDELKAIRWNIIFKRLGIDHDGPEFETFFRHQLSECAIPMDGAMEMLESLRGRYILATASNGPYMQQIRRLDLAGMLGFFDYNFISEKLGVNKPAKEFFDKALAEINEGRSEAERILPENCVVVGDSMTSDMAGGRNAGMKTCFYDPKKGCTEENGDSVCCNADAPYDVLISDLRDVPGVIKKLG